ncbi:hypothetical protein BS50DRAFT_390830 [Corynespora cassiicola Philippines]|uniref:Uncharacterized protein n=1 Tax=Corynespora cassiicola Philippines TaxID=1448308 RepID=A0A2T2NQ60_CORCC|nr:hypothetical protein BS50DRAFT_390830 [Corynespora cassiicola Philippines]
MMRANHRDSRPRRPYVEARPTSSALSSAVLYSLIRYVIAEKASLSLSGSVASCRVQTEYRRRKRRMLKRGKEQACDFAYQNSGESEIQKVLRSD